MSDWGLAILGISFLLIIVFTLFKRQSERRTLRVIPAFEQLRKTIDLSVEDGTRLQISLGSGGLLGPQNASYLIGLTLLRQVSLLAADSDQPPVATSGNGLQNILAHDVLRKTYHELGLSDEYHHRLARVTGLNPSSYGAGTMPLILDNFAASSALFGSFREEAGLITAATQRRKAFSTGGTEDLIGQSILYASTDQALVGEELFATGAYLEAGSAHLASLRMQDILRWLLIMAIVGLAFRSMLAAFV